MLLVQLTQLISLQLTQIPPTIDIPKLVLQVLEHCPPFTIEKPVEQTVHCKKLLKKVSCWQVKQFGGQFMHNPLYEYV
jgi:hypothetical protein